MSLITKLFIKYPGLEVFTRLLYKQTREWKCVKGRYYYDTKETREVGGEKMSSWDELKTGDDGLMEYMSGMVSLRKDA